MAKNILHEKKDLLARLHHLKKFFSAKLILRNIYESEKMKHEEARLKKVDQAQIQLLKNKL